MSVGSIRFIRRGWSPFTIRWPASKIRATARWVAGWQTPSPCRWWAAWATTRRLLWQLVRRYRTPRITAEFPPVSADEATERYLPAMTGSAALAGLKMKHAGAEQQRRLNVHRQPCRAVEVSEARQRRQRERAAAIRARCRAYSPASVQIPAVPPPRPEPALRSGRPFYPV